MECNRFRSTSFILRSVLLAGVVACPLGSLDATPAAPEYDSGPAAGQALKERAVTQGDLPVIIRLKFGAVPEGVLKSQAAVVAQRAGIADAGDRLIERLRQYKVQRVKRFRHLPFVAGTLDAAGLDAALRDPGVLEVYEDRLSRPTLAQSVPLMGASAALSSGFGGSGQVIAVLDTGVDKLHPFLAGKVVHEACFSSNEPLYGASSLCPNGQDTQVAAGAGVSCGSIDGCDHGTHVAGIAAGSATTFSGVAPDADIMAIQVFSRFDSAQDCYYQSPCVLSFTSDQIGALEHVYEQRGNYNIAAVNMSLGGGSYAAACDGEPAKAAIDLLRSVGIATVIASGNDSFTTSIGAPACISSAVSVGSTTESDAVSSFSNSAQILDLLAPGSDITSSVPGGGYARFNGTSMATPHVAGAFAVLRSKSPTASVDLLLSALKTTGRPVTDTRNGIEKPRIQLDTALDALDASEDGLLNVTPIAGYNISGEVGGPFSPASMAYTVSNNGTAPIEFVVVENEAWLEVSPRTGTLIAGADAVVIASLNANAEGLDPGDYVSAISFENLTNGIGSTSRPLGLTVAYPNAQNDKFANSGALQQSSGSTVGNNIDATKESGEPTHADVGGGRSVWWRWVATSAGEITIDTIGSNFDTVLAAYTGNGVAVLTEVAGNDDAAGLQSRITFQAQPGAAYHVAVDGYGTASGSIVLNWNFTQSTTPDTPIEITPDTGFGAAGPVGGPFAPSTVSYTLTNNSSSATTIELVGVPDWLTATIGSGTLAPTQSTSVAWTINGAVASLLPAGNYTQLVSINGIGRLVSLTVTSVGDNNDAFGNATPLSGADVVTGGSNVDATKEVGEPDHAGDSGGRSVWWRWVAPTSGAVILNTFGSNFDTTLGVYTGTNVAALSAVAANDDASAGGLQSEVAFTSVAGVGYYVAVDGYNGVSGAIRLNLTSTGTAAPPANDAFAQAITLSGNPLSINATSVGATKESGEPLHAANAGGRSVWWRWTAAATGPVEFSTLGSDFDTTLGIYTGARVDTLIEVAASDDFDSLAQSRVAVAVTAGSTYYVAVDGFNGASGAVVLNVAPAVPHNDDFADAIPLSGLADTATGFNVGATKQPGEPDHADQPGGHSIWWRWTAPSNAVVEVNTIGSDFDTTLGVYTGASVRSLMRVASNDDFAADLRSKVSFATTAGTIYRIAVDGFGENTGIVKLNLRQDYGILLVDDDDNLPDVRAFYTDTLEAMGIGYSVWDTGLSDFEPGSADLAQYRLVIWFTGGNESGSTGPGPAAELQLQSYLNSGGCLAISSQDYFFARDLTAFMRNYLGVASVIADVQHTVAGGARAFADLPSAPLSYPFANWSDALVPGAAGAVAFNGDAGVAGVHKETSIYRTVFSAFPWEALPSLGQREILMGALLEYCVGGPDGDGDGVPDGQDNCPAEANADQANFDHDALGDACDLDDDNDGLPDTWESDNNLHPRNAADAQRDFDGDGVINLVEYQFAIDPNNPDSDSDNVGDREEIESGRNPAVNEGAVISIFPLLME